VPAGSFGRMLSVLVSDNLMLKGNHNDTIAGNSGGGGNGGTIGPGEFHAASKVYAYSVRIRGMVPWKNKQVWESYESQQVLTTIQRVELPRVR
jgi:hypothetical protein